MHKTPDKTFQLRFFIFHVQDIHLFYISAFSNLTFLPFSFQTLKRLFGCQFWPLFPAFTSASRSSTVATQTASQKRTVATQTVSQKRTVATQTVSQKRTVATQTVSQKRTVASQTVSQKRTVATQTVSQKRTVATQTVSQKRTVATQTASQKRTLGFHDCGNSQTFRLTFGTRVARFFLVQHTKTGKIYEMTIKCTKLIQNIPDDIKYTTLPQN
jgi:hypothetical protein